jgi:hypothetical protein
MAPRARYAIDLRGRLDAREFAQDYVRRARPVLMHGALEGCSALSLWTLEHLADRNHGKSAQLKEWDGERIRTTCKPFDSYAAELIDYAAHARGGDVALSPMPAYLHDAPLRSILPDADVALETFPSDYFPFWYGDQWSAFAQLFLGPEGAVTPLHFDCLLTHNLFFQIRGRKRFVMVAPEKLDCCYPRDWRWSNVDAENPDFERHPLFREAEPAEVVVEPGDALYFPPGTLHHVRSLDCALSFNVDWHTSRSALRGVAAIARGMPLQNVSYNAVIALGLCLGVPRDTLFPYYRSYLNYVS